MVDFSISVVYQQMLDIQNAYWEICCNGSIFQVNTRSRAWFHEKHLRWSHHLDISRFSLPYLFFLNNLYRDDTHDGGDDGDHDKIVFFLSPTPPCHLHGHIIDPNDLPPNKSINNRMTELVLVWCTFISDFSFHQITTSNTCETLASLYMSWHHWWILSASIFRALAAQGGSFGSENMRSKWCAPKSKTNLSYTGDIARRGEFSSSVWKLLQSETIWKFTKRNFFSDNSILKANELH